MVPNEKQGHVPSSIDSRFLDELFNNLQIDYKDTWSPDINKPIFQRRNLGDACVSLQFDNFTRVYGVLRLTGMSDLVLEEAKNEASYMQDVIQYLYAKDVSFASLIMGEDQGVGIYLLPFFEISTQYREKLTNPDSILYKKILEIIDGLDNAIKSTFPGAKTIRAKIDPLTKIEEASKRTGLMVGVPTLKGTSKVFDQQIERIIRGMRSNRSISEKWWLLTLATPIEEKLCLQALENLNEYDFKSTYLDAQKERFERASTIGAWIVNVYFGSENDDAYYRLKGLMKSAFSGTTSFPEPIRIKHSNSQTVITAVTGLYSLPSQGTFDGSIATRPSPRTFTILTSKEICALTRFPVEDSLGFEVFRTSKFNMFFPEENSAKVDEDFVNLGHVMDGTTTTGQELHLKKDIFVKHMLVCGVTGSGKTRTCFNILEQLSQDGIPFLVIEPTKSEYTNLLRMIPNLRVLSIGSPDLPALRINLFEVPKDGFVQRHLDMLKSAFNASFPMGGALPYVLEVALVNVYRKAGWDFSSKKRGVTPSLSMLYREVEKVARSSAYAHDTEADISAALRTRVRSLMQGIKRCTLDCKETVSIEELVNGPTVIELKGLGDDEEKALLMSVLLGIIHEYWEIKGPQDGIRHVTLIEEAHRLFSLSNTIVGDYSGHPKTKAVETLSNMLSELRVYGEGVIVVDQVPTRLVADVIKNTDIKIIHRTVSADDRGVLGSSIGLSSNQIEFLIALPVGQAVCFFEGMNYPTLIKTPEIEVPSCYGYSKYVTSSEVTERMNGNPICKPASIVLPFLGCEFCREQCEHQFSVEPILLNKAFRKDLINLAMKHKKNTITKTPKTENQFRVMMGNKFLDEVNRLGYSVSRPEVMALCAYVQFLNDDKIYIERKRDKNEYVSRIVEQMAEVLNNKG